MEGFGKKGDTRAGMEGKGKYDSGMYFQALAKGDQKALKAIYDVFAPSIAVYLRRYFAQDKAMLDEVISALLVLLWEKRETIAGKEDPVRWMFGIAQKFALQHLAKNNGLTPKIHRTLVLLFKK